MNQTKTQKSDDYSYLKPGASYFQQIIRLTNAESEAQQELEALIYLQNRLHAFPDESEMGQFATHVLGLVCVRAFLKFERAQEANLRFNSKCKRKYERELATAPAASGPSKEDKRIAQRIQRKWRRQKASR